MFGPEAGLLAMGLFSLEPVLLANGGLILTDMTLSCVLFAAVYAFYRYVKRPGVGRLLVCAVAVGLTLAAKQSGAFVLPILAAVAVADAIGLGERAMTRRVLYGTWRRRVLLRSQE